MSESPPPLVYMPANERKSSGCARALLILIFGVLLVSVLAYVTRDSPDKEEPIEAVGETVGQAPETKVQPLLDIHDIAGRSADDVAKVLGQPASKEDTKEGPKLGYQDGAVEIVFIGGKADWITVNPKSPLPFSKEALSRIGLSAGDPTFSNENVLRWEPCGDYLSVSVFPTDGDNMNYVYIKAATK